MPLAKTGPQWIQGDALDAAMRAIGMRIGRSGPSAAADTELTLVSVTVAAAPSGYRLLGVLAAWLEEHHARVDVPRLEQMLGGVESAVVRAWWSGVGTWLGRTDARWRVLEGAYQGEPVALDDPEITALQIARVGEDERFAGSRLRVHAKLLRSRRADVDA